MPELSEKEMKEFEEALLLRLASLDRFLREIESSGIVSRKTLEFVFNF